ncbi:hypothetical protein BDN72DRAFT_857341 [Pluteus cervinus]|uniref:Uncharacterized protein n=1 Tax=Pluteus cervinus TaxID=181527 RepID=A0ACD3AVX1_9AGAR|nr:hypothetical protein BDN72DRAFT_857341 [Pluteus cervinus]
MAHSILEELPYWGLEGGLSNTDIAIPTRSARLQKNRLYTTTLIELRRSASRHGTRRARLIYFVEVVPLEITDHILGFLHPLDLHHLIRTTTYLRRLLLTPKAGHCWLNSYLNYPDFPPYPKGCSPPRWVGLLFGDYTLCDFCDNIEIRVVEAIHIHQLCSRLTDVPVYWKTEAEEIIRTYSTLKYRAELREKGAQLALDTYISKRIKSVDEVHKRKEAYIAWAEHVDNLIKIDQARRQKIHLPKIKARFLEEGFTRDDLQSLRLRDCFSTQALGAFSYLSSSRWNKFSAGARPILNDIKRLRLIEERSQLILRRYNALADMYDTYVLSLRLLEIPLMPVELPILRFQTLQDVLFHKSTDEVDDRICEALASQFADEWKEWNRERSRETAGEVVREYPDVIERSQNPIIRGRGVQSALEVHWPSSSNKPACMGPRNLTQTESLIILRLPFSVFTCTRCNLHDAIFHPLLGWDEISPHLGCQTSVSTDDMPRFEKHLVDAEPNLKFSKVHSEFMFEFVKVAMGRDPYGTTMKKLDQLGDRFICKTCIPVAGGGKAYSWRECLDHYHYQAIIWRGSKTPFHTVSSFVRLSSEAAGEVISREPPQSTRRSVWACTLCPAGVNTLRYYEGVKDHVRAELSPSSKRKPARLLYTGAARTDRKCTRCSSGRVKLWSERGLTSHLRDKHGIENVTEQDYRVVKLLVTDPD